MARQADTRTSFAHTDAHASGRWRVKIWPAADSFQFCVGGEIARCYYLEEKKGFVSCAAYTSNRKSRCAPATAMRQRLQVDIKRRVDRVEKVLPALKVLNRVAATFFSATPTFFFSPFFSIEMLLLWRPLFNAGRKEWWTTAAKDAILNVLGSLMCAGKVSILRGEGTERTGGWGGSSLTLVNNDKRFRTITYFP